MTTIDDRSETVERTPEIAIMKHFLRILNTLLDVPAGSSACEYDCGILRRDAGFPAALGGMLAS